LNLLLDTHVLLWRLNDDKRIPRNILKLIENDSNSIFVSAASAWEISIKKALGKLRAPYDLDGAIRLSDFVHLPVSIPHAILAGQLPLHHNDPFDRLLIAQSIIEGLTLVTRDQRQILYDVKVIEA
jgi:PIN domain nuclease of toxin-antitoxin system